MDVPTFIRNHEAVVEFFGCWPSFHDAEVVSYEPAPDSVSLTIHGWLMTDEVDAKGYFVLRNHALVTFRFSDLHDVQMDAFKADNILSILEISQSSDPASCHVELHSVMDMSGSFSARAGEIVSVVPCTPDGRAA